jgi:hypothetical protein
MSTTDNTYKVDFNKLVSWLLPLRLFKPKLFALCKALVSPLSTLHADFIVYRLQKKYELEITGQVCKLERLLNDKFDADLRRIYITDGEKSKRKYVYSKNELAAKHIYKDDENKPLYIYQQSEIATTTYHFIVNVPLGLSYNADVFVSILSQFKMPSKKFKIVTF